jgi:hypothetical protein
MNDIYTYLGIAFAATIKFVGGPLAGLALKANWHFIAIFSTVGLMISVTGVLYFGPYILKLIDWFKKNKKKTIFSKTSRYAVKVKNKLGLWGIALLTPFLFTPIVGSFIALSFKYSKTEILWKMALCGIFAGYVQTVLLFYLKEVVVKLFTL